MSLIAVLLERPLDERAIALGVGADRADRAAALLLVLGRGAAVHDPQVAKPPPQLRDCWTVAGVDLPCLYQNQ